MKYNATKLHALLYYIECVSILLIPLHDKHSFSVLQLIHVWYHFLIKSFPFSLFFLTSFVAFAVIETIGSILFGLHYVIFENEKDFSSMNLFFVTKKIKIPLFYYIKF